MTDRLGARMFLLIRVTLNVLAVYLGIRAGVSVAGGDFFHGLVVAVGMITLLVLLANLIATLAVKEYDNLYEWWESYREKHPSRRLV